MQFYQEINLHLDLLFSIHAQKGKLSWETLVECARKTAAGVGHSLIVQVILRGINCELLTYFQCSFAILSRSFIILFNKNGFYGCETPKLGEWLQHIPGLTSEVFVQKSAVLVIAKILYRTLNSEASCRGFMIEEDTDHP